MKWISTVLLRNTALIWIFAGGWHLILYQLKLQQSEKKYDPNWQAVNSKRFMFSDQARACCHSDSFPRKVHVWCAFVYLQRNNKVTAAAFF
jgi:hypothetical protein